MAEDHGLADGDGAIDIGERLELLMLTFAIDVVLFDVGQSLLLTSQSDQHRIGHHGLRKLHHLAVISRREEQHLTVLAETPVLETQHAKGTEYDK